MKKKEHYTNVWSVAFDLWGVILEGSDDVTAADRSGDISDETMLSEEQH